jgi:signal transduction histidine kinase
MTSPRIITAYRILVWLIALILICLCFEFFTDLIVGGHGKFPQFLNVIMVSGLVIALFVLALINRRTDRLRQYIHSREIRQRNRKLATLNNLIIKANQSLDLGSILQTVLQESMEALGAEGGMIHLLEADENRLVVATRHGLSERFSAMAELTSMPTDIPCMVIATHRSQECFNTGPISCRFVCAAAADGWQGIAGIPILAKNRLIGVMHVMTRTGREYAADDIRFATTIGRQVGILIEHARMFAELNWKNEELLRSHALLERSSHQLALSRNRLNNNLALVERANEELEGLARMKSHFLGMISHEFRTPLTGILGSAEFLIAHHGDIANDEARRLLEMIRQGGVRLNEIVNDLLKVARLEATAPPLAGSPLHLQDILGVLISQFTPLLAERRQRIVCGDLSALPYFSGDREYLEEVFTELLENAGKFTPDGGDIDISAQVVDRHLLVEKEAIIRRFNSGFYESMGDKCYILVEVRDSGIGISSTDQVKVFDKFYEVGDIRHHSTGKHKFQGKGTGLGLTIVKGMVEAHGGMVWVESRPDHSGSSFSLLLPLEDQTIQPVLPFMQGEDKGSPQKGHD